MAVADVETRMTMLTLVFHAEEENDMTLTNIARGKLMSEGLNDFFGDNEISTVGIEQYVFTDQQNSIFSGTGNDWNLNS